jgi:ribonuclease P protein component
MTVFYLRTQVEVVPEPNEAGTTGALRAAATGRVRVGFTVSKALGGSVERNRMRRRTREAVRHHLQVLKGVTGTVDVVINPKRTLLLADFAAISQEIERAFRVIRQSSLAPEAKREKREKRRR